MWGFPLRLPQIRFADYFCYFEVGYADVDCDSTVYVSFNIDSGNVSNKNVTFIQSQITFINMQRSVFHDVKRFLLSWRLRYGTAVEWLLWRNLA